MSWHTQSIRPLTRADVARFVVGYGLAGWVAGYVEVIHGDYLVIDTGKPQGALSGFVVADIVQVYSFMDELPTWADASGAQRDSRL